MDELIRRSFEGRLNDVESGRLRAWRRASADNEARYRELLAVWEATAPAAGPGRPVPPDALRRVLIAAERRRRGPGFRVWRMVAAAAVLIAAIGVGSWYVLGRRGEPDPIGAAVFATGEDERVTVTLNDGSFVRLSPKSRMSFMPSRGSRDVWLDGRAFFAVAPDPKRPFQVRTRSGNATALGTRFEVLLDDEQLRLAVVEGRVALEVAGGDVEVGAGEVSHAMPGSPPSVERIDDMATLLDLPPRLLVFQATPMPQVAREVERAFGVTMTLTNPRLAERLVTAWFEGDSLGAVIGTICRVTQTSCAIRGDSIILQP